MSKTGIGVTIIRKGAYSKVTGDAKYTDDFVSPSILTAKMVTSKQAHALIKKIDLTKAFAETGIKAILTGSDLSILCGPIIKDRPPLAKEKVRYYGEPVALVIANSECQATRAASLIEVEYESLPPVLSPSAALAPQATLVHENLGNYQIAVTDAYPQTNSNICNHVKIRKGDMKAFEQCDVIIEGHFTLPQSAHMAMETRTARAKIDADENVFIKTSSQSPFEVRKILSEIFALNSSKVIVEVPFVGGGFGGKSSVQLEILAYLASKAVGGAEVRITNSRENDFVSSPCRMGLEATIKLGATKEGLIKAAQMTYLVDTGAYSDIGPRLAKAMAVDCTSPYNIENVICDCLCVYTNHPYVTAFRSFSHESSAFCIERMMDKLASRLQIDPSELRRKNSLIPGHYSPTQVKITSSNFGDLIACIDKLKTLIGWQEGLCLEADGKIRAKGMACLWKTSNSPPDATSGAFITFNEDGSINLNCGCVECGPGMKTTAAQILSEKLQMDIKRINVNMDVNTRYCPEHWKTVASQTTFMVGNAVLQAAEDVIKQLKSLAATVLRCRPEDLDVGEERIYVQQDQTIFLTFADLAHGYQYPGGNVVGGPIMGRGGFTMRDINLLDKETGRGKSGPSWTVGAQAVEIEFDKKEYTYRLTKAATVIDAGKVINPKMAESLVKGGMCMGLGLGSREYFAYDHEGAVLNTSLRSYKVMHFGETPQYLVDFVETPQIDAPFQARGLGEHGIIGMAPALANALTLAAQVEFDQLPITPELIWQLKEAAHASL